MSVDVSTVYLFDVAVGTLVEAELRDAIEDPHLADWEALWRPSLDAAIQRLHAEGVPRQQWPQSRHWDWRDKLREIGRLLAHRTFCIVCRGQTQGLMAVNVTTKKAWLGPQRGQPLVYVEFLETAPWNRRVLYDPPRYGGIGSLLIRAAIALSLEEEFKGRIGLHSLPQADDFYRDSCGMTDLGQDPTYQNLRYFEMTPEQAKAFIEKGEK